ncbi:MAG: tetratricopeptide repeat protein [Planctomycetota bacterium]
MATTKHKQTTTSDVAPWIGVAVLLLITFIAYLPALRGDFIWDDDDYVTKNPTLNDLDGLRRIWFEIGATRQYYPLVYTTFWIEKHIWGLNPLGYHVVNVVLHGVGAGLLWLILRRLAVPGALLAAAVFALHPLHVESVAWITERKNVLSGVFYFAAALAYLRSNESKSRIRASVLSLVLFVFALSSKSVTFSLPVALLLVQWWRSGRIRERDASLLWHFFILGLMVACLTVWMENTNVGAGGPEWHRPALVRLLTAGHAFWFYLGKLVWPDPLIFVYPKWNLGSARWIGYAVPMCAVALVASLFALRTRIGRGPIAATLFYAGTIFPALGFFNVYYAIRYSPVADHFAYLASLGPIVLLAAAWSLLVKRTTTSALVSISGGAAMCLLLGVLTWNQCGVYRDLESLWTDTIRKNPTAAMAHLNLGSIRQKQGRHADAAELFRKTLDLEPPTSIAHFNLGTSLLNLNRTDDAITQFEAALRLQPNYPKCLANLGNAWLTKGRAAEAINPLTQAVEFKPDYALAHQNLATAFEQLGRFAEAERHYREAARLNPQDRASLNSAERLKLRR